MDRPEADLILRSAMIEVEVASAAEAAGGGGSPSPTRDWKGSGEREEGLSKYDFPEDFATGDVAKSYSPGGSHGLITNTIG